jgi:hypothetical protein
LSTVERSKKVGELRSTIDKIFALFALIILELRDEPLQPLHGVLTLCLAIETSAETFGKKASGAEFVAPCTVQFDQALPPNGHCASRLPRRGHSIRFEVLGRRPSAPRNLTCNRSWKDSKGSLLLLSSIALTPRR